MAAVWVQDTDFEFLEADVKWVYRCLYSFLLFCSERFRPGVDLHDADPMSVQLSKGSDFKARGQKGWKGMVAKCKGLSVACLCFPVCLRHFILTFHVFFSFFFNA